MHVAKQLRSFVHERNFWYVFRITEQKRHLHAKVIVDEGQKHRVCEGLELWDKYDSIVLIDHLFNSQN